MTSRRTPTILASGGVGAVCSWLAIALWNLGYELDAQECSTSQGDFCLTPQPFIALLTWIALSTAVASAAFGALRVRRPVLRGLATTASVFALINLWAATSLSGGDEPDMSWIPLTVCACAVALIGRGEVDHSTRRGRYGA